MATELLETETASASTIDDSAGEAAQRETLRRIPQGKNRILVIGPESLVAAHAALSPSSRHTRSDRLGEATSKSASEASPFDAVVIACGDGASDADLEALRRLSAEGAALVWLHVRPARASDAPDFDEDAAQAALDAAGWRTIDVTTVAKRPDAEDTLSKPPRDGPGAPSATIIRAVNGEGQPAITVAALGMRKVAGVTDARIDHPMAALASHPLVRAAWGAGGVEVPSRWSPGVLILHRQFLDGAGFIDAIEKRIAAGWVIVSEIDDDPRHWPQYAKAGYRAFRGVHAVSVSTEPLARMIRRWNPHVIVFPNAAPYLPPVEPGTPKSGHRLRVFFGALNREKDWAGIVRALEKVALELADRIEFVVVHDRTFFDALPDAPKSFTETLPYDDYLALLATCDIALLPLGDNPFNRLKSDIKFVECCAAGVVPICSETIYAESDRHREIGVFADSPKDWMRALRALVRDPDDLMRRRHLAMEYVKAERMHADQAARREETFRALLADRAALEKDRQARLAG